MDIEIDGVMAVEDFGFPYYRVWTVIRGFEILGEIYTDGELLTLCAARTGRMVHTDEIPEDFDDCMLITSCIRSFIKYYERLEDGTI